MVNKQTNGEAKIRAKTNVGLTKRIFEGLLSRLGGNDKSEHEKVKNALVDHFAENQDSFTNILTKYRLRFSALTRDAVAVLLSVIKTVLSNSNDLTKTALEEFVTFAFEELTATTKESSPMQNDALEVLVTLGCKHDCKMVMKAFVDNLRMSSAWNALAFECFSKLCEHNSIGVISYNRSVLAPLCRCLDEVMNEKLRKAKVSAIVNFCKALLQNSTDKTQSEKDDATQSKSQSVAILNCKSEIFKVYNLLFNQWLHSRDTEISIDILHALTAVGSLFSENDTLPKTLHETRNNTDIVRKEKAKKESSKEKTLPKGKISSTERIRSKYINLLPAKKRGPNLRSGAAKRRLALYLSRGFSREEAKLKALYPMRKRPVS